MFRFGRPAQLIGMTWFQTPVAVALIPGILAFAATLYGLSDKPLWLDEVITHVRSNLPISNLITSSLHNKHFPTYFFLASAFDAPIIDEWMLRLPSVIFGAIAVMLVAIVATEIKSPRAGLAAGALMALAPLDVQLGQEARPYTLVSCLVMLALWGLVRIARQSAITFLSSSRSKSERVSWAAYTIGTIGALNVLLVTAFWLIASNIAIAIIIRRTADGRWNLIRNWAIAQTIIVVAWLPGLVAIYLAAERGPFYTYRWVPASTLEHVWSVIAAAYLYRASNVTTFALLPTPVPWLGVALVGLALLGAWRLKADVKQLSVVALAAITMPVALAILSIYAPFWITRYLLWSTGPFFILAGLGLAGLSRPLFPVAATALAVAAIINLAPYYRSETKPRWDLAAAYLAENVQPGDAIITNDAAARYVLVAYADRYRLDRTIVSTTQDVSTTAAHFALSQQRLWVVYGRAGQGTMAGEDVYLQKWLAFGDSTSKVRFGKDIVAMRFDLQSIRSVSRQDQIK
jgi:mannosyltransferase